MSAESEPPADDERTPLSGRRRARRSPVVIGFLLLYSLRLTQVLSRMSDRIQELIMHAAVLEARVGELRRRLAEDDPPPTRAA